MIEKHCGLDLTIGFKDEEWLNHAEIVQTIDEARKASILAGNIQVTDEALWAALVAKQKQSILAKE